MKKKKKSATRINFFDKVLYVPVKERLNALAVGPDIVVEVKIVSVAMSWVNLKGKEKGNTD